MTFKVLDIAPEDLQKAKSILADQIVNNSKSLHNSIEETNNFNLVGILGELAFHKLFPEAIPESTKDYDFIHNDHKIDVKTKHYNDHIFTGTHEMSIPEYTIKKITDKLLFSIFIINADFTKIFYFGTIDKIKYKNHSTIYKAGQSVFRTNSYVIQLQKLSKFKIKDF